MTATPDVFSLVYLSEATDEHRLLELVRLTDLASMKNHELGVTGFLLYPKKMFVQYLEGAELAVASLFNKIVQDPRHVVTQKVELGRAPRRFTNWGMQLLTPVWTPDIEFQGSLHVVLDLVEVVDGLDLAEQIRGIVDGIAVSASKVG